MSQERFKGQRNKNKRGWQKPTPWLRKKLFTEGEHSQKELQQKAQETPQEAHDLLL